MKYALRGRIVIYFCKSSLTYELYYIGCYNIESQSYYGWEYVGKNILVNMLKKYSCDYLNRIIFYFIKLIIQLLNKQ